MATMPTEHLFYGRHFVLLLCALAVLAAVDPWPRPHETIVAFGAYGALHSCLLALTLRARQALLRKGLFVALAALLSSLSALLALYGRRYVDGFPGMSGLRWLVTLSAGLGATSYVILIRYFWSRDLPLRSIVFIPLGCMLATLGLLRFGSLSISSGGLALAAGWWLAFSAGLWCNDGGWRSFKGRPREGLNR